MKPKCPICKVPTKVKSVYDSDIHFTVEEYEKCMDGCGRYYYEFAYGANCEYINGKKVVWSYNESKTKRRNRSFVRKSILRRERKKWRGRSE